MINPNKSIIKAILKETFPSVRFIVNIKVDRLTVTYVDGPLYEEVTDLLSCFEEGAYNPSSDLRSTHTDNFAFNGQFITPFAHIFIDNYYSPEITQVAAKAMQDGDRKVLSKGYRDQQESGEAMNAAVNARGLTRNDSPTRQAIELIPDDCDVNNFLSNQVARQLATKEKQELIALFSTPATAAKPSRL